MLGGSPWPEMRRDSRNTAESPIRGRYRGDRPSSFRTGRGIFSTPVIGDDSTAYVGSADGYFYALGDDGDTVWRLRTVTSELAPATGKLVNWWEGNVAYGPDGNLYVIAEVFRLAVREITPG